MLRQIFSFHYCLDKHAGKSLLVQIPLLYQLVDQLSGLLCLRFHVFALFADFRTNAVNKLEHIVKREVASFPLVKDIVLHPVTDFLGVLLARCSLPFIKLHGSDLTEEFIVAFSTELFELG